jgi:hypothetical protein
MRPAVLDRLVRNARKKEDKRDPELLLPHWAVRDWPEPVEGDALLRDLIARERRHVIYDDALTTALWLMFAWAHDIAVHSPILLLSSAEPECGEVFAAVFNVLSRTARNRNCRYQQGSALSQHPVLETVLLYRRV